MSEHQEKCTVEANERLAPGVHRLTLTTEQIAVQARPGQFVMVASSRTLDPLLRRPFSIHRILDDGRLQLLIKVVGRGTELLCQAMVGQQLDLIGPLGRGFHLEPESSPCFIGGGIGIAPLLFLADIWRKQAPTAQAHVLLGGRTGQEIETVAGDFQQLGLSVATATDDGSLGHHGLVTDLFAGQIDSVGKVFTCGPTPMMAVVANLCAQANLSCEVSLEAHMACGLGACLGCAVPAVGPTYKHVCKHGPVFRAEEVAWQ